jgi:hypothetical protein
MTVMAVKHAEKAYDCKTNKKFNKYLDVVLGVPIFVT